MRRVLLVDDHPLVRMGIKQALLRLFGQIAVTEAGSARETLDCIQKEEFDVVLLDVDLPDQSGLDILLDIRNFRPRLPVLYLSGKSEEEFAARALKGGAAGFLSKVCSPDEMGAAIRKALAGEKYLSPGLAEKLALSALTGGMNAPHSDLSAREFQVLRMIGAGKSLTEIGVELSLSVKTISTYRTRILEKMGMQSNAELTRYAIKHGLVD